MYLGSVESKSVKWSGVFLQKMVMCSLDVPPSVPRLQGRVSLVLDIICLPWTCLRSARGQAVSVVVCDTSMSQASQGLSGSSSVDRRDSATKAFDRVSSMWDVSHLKSSSPENFSVEDMATLHQR